MVRAAPELKETLPDIRARVWVRFGEGAQRLNSGLRLGAEQGHSSAARE